MIELDVHPASEAERLAIYENVHEIWGRGRTLEEHIAVRLASVTHQRAEWFAGVVEGEVVTSCGCYPQVFRRRGQAIPGFAICAVHTRPDHRGRGLAPRFLREVERQQAERGKRLAILYSDIGLDYYARLGYVAGRSHQGRATIDPSVSAEDEFVETTPAEYAPTRNRIETTWPLVIERTDEYETHLAMRVRIQRYFLVPGDAGGESIAAFALSVDEAKKEAWIAEFTVGDDPAEQQRAARAMLAAVGDLGVSTLRGWLPDLDALRDVFEIEPRTEELTMLKPLDPHLHLDADALTATDWWHEIDHV